MHALEPALPYLVLLQLALTVVLALLLFGLARQIGVLHERIAPMGAMTSDRGPQVGEPAPALTAPTLEGLPVELGGPSADGRSRLLLFVAPSCPVCKKLLPIAQSFMRAEHVRVVIVGDGELAEQRALVQRFGLEGLTYVSSPRVGMTYQVGKLPYGVLLDAQGIIRAKGLVNTREHLESLLNAEETGFGTIQAYLAAGHGAGAPDSARSARVSTAPLPHSEVSET